MCFPPPYVLALRPLRRELSRNVRLLMCIAVILSPYFLCVLRILYSLQALLQCVAINILLTAPEKKAGERPRTRNSIRLSAFFSFIYRRTNKPRGQKTINEKKSSKTFICHLPNCLLPFWRKKNPFNRFLMLLLPIRPGFSCSHCTNSQMMPPYGRRKRGCGWVA